MIHTELADGATQLLAAAEAAERAAMAKIALPVIGSGLHLALVDMTLFLLDQELAEG